jgi:hypothetical protein
MFGAAVCSALCTDATNALSPTGSSHRYELREQFNPALKRISHHLA